jgi:hypothetical protein
MEINDALRKVPGWRYTGRLTKFSFYGPQRGFEKEDGNKGGNIG